MNEVTRIEVGKQYRVAVGENLPREGFIDYWEYYNGKEVTVVELLGSTVVKVEVASSALMCAFIDLRYADLQPLSDRQP